MTELSGRTHLLWMTRHAATEEVVGHSPFTSPLRGEVARNERVGVITTHSEFAAVTPSRTCGPTLPLKGRVS